jgi:outer membrane protein assembly factor BamA
MPIRPITIAARVMHYGRYGPDAEYQSFSPLYIGYDGLIRGYDFNSFSVDECDQATQTCPILNRLIGSRMLIANAELRFPLLGIFGASNYYGPFPIEGLAFYDAGVAWGSDSATRPTFLGGDTKPVSSVGGGIRVNVFGLLVFEVDYVKPLDRPKKGAFWQFNFIPGF